MRIRAGVLAVAMATAGALGVVAGTAGTGLGRVYERAAGGFRRVRLRARVRICLPGLAWNERMDGHRQNGLGCSGSRQSAQSITSRPEEGACWYPHDVRSALSCQLMIGNADFRRDSP